MVGLGPLVLVVEIPSEDPFITWTQETRLRPKTYYSRFTIFEVNNGETGKVAILDGEAGARELLVG